MGFALLKPNEVVLDWRFPRYRPWEEAYCSRRRWKWAWRYLRQAHFLFHLFLLLSPENETWANFVHTAPRAILNSCQSRMFNFSSGSTVQTLCGHIETVTTLIPNIYLHINTHNAFFWNCFCGYEQLAQHPIKWPCRKMGRISEEIVRLCRYSLFSDQRKNTSLAVSVFTMLALL